MKYRFDYKDKYPLDVLLNKRQFWYKLEQVCQALEIKDKLSIRPELIRDYLNEDGLLSQTGVIVLAQNMAPYEIGDKLIRWQGLVIIPVMLNRANMCYADVLDVKKARPEMYATLLKWLGEKHKHILKTATTSETGELFVHASHLHTLHTFIAGTWNVYHAPKYMGQ